MCVGVSFDRNPCYCIVDVLCSAVIMELLFEAVLSMSM